MIFCDILYGFITHFKRNQWNTKKGHVGVVYRTVLRRERKGVSEFYTEQRQKLKEHQTKAKVAIRSLRAISQFQVDQQYSKRKRNYSYITKQAKKMGLTKVDTIESLIEKCILEISTLIERNDSIKDMNDSELKQEYLKNEELIALNKKKLKELSIVKSEPLHLQENRSKLENLIKRKFFYTNAFEIYGGFSGLMDYGPSGCLLKSELEKLWRHHFIFYDEMLEISSTCVTPYIVLKMSGHVDRFTDLMIKDEVTGDCYRADKYLSEVLNNKIKELAHGNTNKEGKSDERRKQQHEMTNGVMLNGNKREVIDIDTVEKKKIEEKQEGKKKQQTNTVEHLPKEVQKQIEEIELIVRKLDGMDKNEIEQIIEKYNILSPEKNKLSKPFPFNLMFQTKIGPKEDVSIEMMSQEKKGIDEMKKKGPLEENNAELNEAPNVSSVAYLRPETAQGIFVNFKKLLEYNGGKMPFAAAQIGLGFRNEISPRNGLLRVREFQMAEIEYFVNPNKKKHDKYYLFKHLVLPLFPRNNQLSDGSIVKNLTLEEAVERKIIGNEALAYFLARTYLFLLKCGINKDGIRFRQHLNTEMAHYASDCWDAEILTSYGFVEVVGHADRSAYDLTRHSELTKAALFACEKYSEPKSVEVVKVIPNKALIGNKFKKEQAIIYQALEEKSNEELLRIDEELNKTNKYTLKVCNESNKAATTSFELTRDMIAFKTVTKTVHEETFVPNVIEPSFGIGRLIFCILEHSFRIRHFEDDKEERNYLALPYKLAPIKCSILSLSNNKAFYPYIKEIQMFLNENDISCKLDNSSVSIGKKYARTDEIGIPFAITVDFQTLKDKTVTLRDRDSMLQIRIQISALANIINSLIHQRKTMNCYIREYGLFTQQDI